MAKGRLIVIEGATDGIGKTTQFNLLKNRLEKDGYNIQTHHFPTYNSEQGKLVELYLEGKLGKVDELSNYLINSIYAVDRAITWNKNLKKTYENGEIILLDRYTTSSLIYQSALIDNIDKKKKFIDYVCDYEYNKLGIKSPDEVIFLHAPFDLVTKMRNARKSNDGIENDIHERNIEYMKKVYENAMFIADYLSWSKVECSNNNKMKSINDIHNEIYTLVKTRTKK